MMKTLQNLLLIFSLAVAFTGYGQVATYYTFSQLTGTYTPITGGSVVITATDVTASSTASLDAGTYALPLPFPFNFNGTSYTTCNVNVNGNITFGATAPGTSNTAPISVATAYDGAISAMSKDLWGVYNSIGSFSSGSNIITGVTDFTGISIGAVLRSATVGTGIPASTTVTGFNTSTGTITMSANANATSANVSIMWTLGEIRAEAIGTAPNRTFVIQFKGMADYATTASAGGNLNFQIQLDEGNGNASQQIIRIVYGPSNNLLTTGRTNQVGLRGLTNADYNNRASTTDWAATTAGTANSSTVTRSNTIFPASGLTYTWTPPSPCTDPPTPGTTTANSTFVCSSGAVNLDLSGNSTGTGQTYQWQSCPTLAGTYVNVGSSQIFTAKTVNPTTDTYYRCALTCSSGTTYSTPIQIIINTGLSGSYTINSALPSGGTNFHSYADAVSALSCGITGPVTFDVDPASGPYTEQVVIPQITGASAANRVTFNGNGTTIQFAPVTGARHIVKLDGADYVTLKNINVLELSSAYAFGIHLMNEANFDSIINCRVDISANTSTTSTQFAGIVASGSTTSPVTAGNAANNLVISGCTVIGGYYGISLVGPSATIRCTQNRIINDTLKNFYSIGIQLLNNDSCVINGNDISRTSLVAVGTFEGIEVAGGNKRTIISNNRIHDTHTAATTQSGAAYGIFHSANDAPADSSDLVYNNLVYNFNSATGTIYGLYNSSSDGVRYYQNTIVLNNASSSSGTTYGLYQVTAATNIEIKNNLIFVSRGGSGTQRCLHFATSASTIVSESNNLFVGTTGTGTNEIGYYAVGFPTLANWKTANSNAYDQFSKSVTPAFADIAAADFTPTAPALNNMSPLISFITTDINGAPRGANGPFTEPGAYEYTPGACSFPIAGDAISANPLPPCAGGLFTLDLVNFSANSGQVYTWEASATSGGPFTPISTGQNTAGLQTSATSAMFYRCVVTCPATSQSSTSTEVQVTVTPALLAGTYTIDAALPAGGTNFTTIASAASAINCGVTGSIIFDIANGTYNERVDIYSVIPPGANDSIVFRSASGDTSMVHIQWPASGTAGSNSIFSIKSSRNIVFRNLSFERTGTGTYATIFDLDTTTGIKFFGNNMVLPLSTATTANSSHIYSLEERTEDSTVVIGNTMTGGTNGTWFYSNINRPALGTRIENNIVKTSYTGVFLKNHDGVIIRNNKIPRFNNASTDFYGISIENCDSGVLISNNYILSGRGYGIKLTGCAGRSTSRNKVVNNSVSLDQGAGTALAYGLQVESVTAYNTANTDIYHNTVRVKSSSATTGRVINFIGSATAQNDSIIIKNNILVNAGTGYVYYIPASSLSATTKFDRNNIYTAGANIGTWNATTGFPFSQQSWVLTTGMDSLSSFVPVNIIDSSDLHLAGASIGDFNLATDLTSLSAVDMDGNTRTGTYFYKGAFESTPLVVPSNADAGILKIDSIGPMSATGITNVYVTLKNNGFAPLTSVDIYYRLNGLAGAPTSWTGSLAPGKFVSVSLGSVSLPIQTNIIEAWTENTNSTASDLNRFNDSAKISTSTNDPLNGTYSVGPGLNFTNLTAAANAIRTRFVTGNVIFELDQTYSGAAETFPVIFTTRPETYPYTFTVRPAPGVTALLTEGTPASANDMFKLDSTVGFIFDGRPGGIGTTSEWTIRNKQTTTTYGANILLISGAQHNTIKYITFEGQQSSTTGGLVMLYYTSAQARGCSYNTIDNCVFRDRTDLTTPIAPALLLYSYSAGTYRNENNTVTNNKFINFNTNAIYLNQGGNGGNWTFADNHFYYNLSTPSSATQIVMNITGGANSIGGINITGNYIGGSAPFCGGTPLVNSSSSLWSGIVVSTDSMVYSNINNNTIANISKTGTGAAGFVGISAQRGRFKINNNTIGNPATANNISCAGTSYMYGIEVQNDLGTADTIVINNNTVANLTGTGTGTSTRIRGISFGFTTDVAPLVYIDHNTVHHLSTAGTAVGYGVDQVTALGILAFPSTYHLSSKVSNNTVYAIEASNTTAVATISAGICASNFAGDMFNNIVYDIKNKSTANPGTGTSVSAGIYNRFMSNFKAYNNMISLTGTGNSDNAQLNGILIAGNGGGTHNYYYNSIHIENSTGNSVSSFAFHRGQNDLTVASGHPIVLRNNIFNNSIFSAGNHYAIGIEDTLVIVAGVSDWNIFKTSNVNTVGLLGTLSYNLANWRTRTSNDANTKSVSINFNAVNTADLHLVAPSIGDLNLAGTPVVAVTTDIDGNIRDLAKPYMGADENTASPLPVKLVQFNASAINNDVRLNWVTASEINSNRFEIERSADGKTFKVVAKVKASGKSDNISNYQQTDANAFSAAGANTLYYRLKMIDNDGASAYSNVAIVNIKDAKINHSLTAFPNPYNDHTYLQVYTADAATAYIIVTDITGKVVLSSSEKVAEGTTTIQLQSAETLQSGIYFVSLEINGTKQLTKLIKQ